MKAIYKVIENGNTSYFRSGIVGGYSYPFFVYEYAKRMAALINDNDLLGKIDVASCFRCLKRTRIFPKTFAGNTFSSRSPPPRLPIMKRECHAKTSFRSIFLWTLTNGK